MCDLEKTRRRLRTRRDKSPGDFQSPGLFVYRNKKEKTMSWIYLFIAGGFDIVWAIGLKYTQGFTRPLPSIITIAGMIVSFYFLSLATKTLPIGTAYTVWTGIGAVGAITLGVILFKEPFDLPRILFMLLIVTGIIGLRFVSPH